MMQTKPEVFLAELAEKLHAIKHRKLATQLEIERQTGVDQTTISRVMNQERKRVTRQLHTLMNYADMLLVPKALSDDVTRAAQDFLRCGGSETELIASIEHGASLVSRRLARR